MKKYIATLMMIVIPAVSFPLVMPQTAEAQKRYVQRVVGRDGRVRYRRVAKPSFYRRHRNRTNLAIGTGGGAIIGGLLGGGKGALIGAGIGAGSSALYTYKLNPKTRKYYKVRRTRRN